MEGVRGTQEGGGGGVNEEDKGGRKRSRTRAESEVPDGREGFDGVSREQSAE